MISIQEWTCIQCLEETWNCIEIEQQLFDIFCNTKRIMTPNPNIIFPVTGCKTVTHVRPTVNNPNIIVGDFTYFSDTDFEKNVLHHYDFYGDRLIIGKFCQIASGVTFIMNGANHQMNSVSTYPFYIMSGWTEMPPSWRICL